MKSFRSTGILSFFVVVLAVYTVWEYKKANREDGFSDAQEVKLLRFANDDVQQISLKHPDESIVLLKDGADWKMKSPIADDAETSAVDAFLYSLQIQKGKIFRGEEESKSINWAEFGLEPAGTVIELKGSKNTETVSVSSKNAYDGSFYVRVGDRLLLGDRGLAQIVSRDAKALRARRLWRATGAQIERIDAQFNSENLKEKFQVSKNGDKWTLDPQPSYAVDNTRIESWIESIQALLPSEIVGEDTAPEGKSNDLLVKPASVITFHLKKVDGAVGDWTLTAGQDKAGETYMFTNQRPTIYKTASSAFQSLRVGRDYFRDGKIAFKFPVEQVTEVEILTAKLKAKIKKDGSNWKSEDSKTELDQDKLVELIHGLSGLEAQEFIPIGQAKGFAPDQRIVIRGNKGQVLLDFQWGAQYKGLRPFNKNMTFRFAKTNLEKEAMGLDATKLASLIDPQLVKKNKVDKK